MAFDGLMFKNPTKTENEKPRLKVGIMHHFMFSFFSCLFVFRFSLFLFFGHINKA